MRGLSLFVEIVILIGALNWGFVGFFDFNPVQALFGPGFARIIYAVVGVCALYEILAWRPVHASLSPQVRSVRRV